MAKKIRTLNFGDEPIVTPKEKPKSSPPRASPKSNPITSDLPSSWTHAVTDSTHNVNYTVPLDSDWPGRAASCTSPATNHTTPQAYLAEVLMLHRYGDLQPQFWLNPQYESSYKGFLMRASKLVKQYGFITMNNVIVRNRLASLSGATFVNAIRNYRAETNS